jgi:aspartokinase
VIWTDVDGVLSADPRRVPVDRHRFALMPEAIEPLRRSDHPQTMAPAVEKRIPIWIKNTFAPRSRIHHLESPNSVGPSKTSQHRRHGARRRAPE